MGLLVAVFVLVEVARRYSNLTGTVSDLGLNWTHLHQAEQRHSVEVAHVVTRHGRTRPIVHRLSSERIDRLVNDYVQGVQARELACKYGIGLTSVKELLRRRGVRRRP